MRGEGESFMVFSSRKAAGDSLKYASDMNNPVAVCKHGTCYAYVLLLVGTRGHKKLEDWHIQSQEHTTWFKYWLQHLFSHPGWFSSSLRVCSGLCKISPLHMEHTWVHVDLGLLSPNWPSGLAWDDMSVYIRECNPAWSNSEFVIVNSTVLI